MRNQLVMVGVVTVLAAASAEAQPAPAPWYRFTLVDGRIVDGQIVGGDAVSYYVQTTGGLFSLARTQVARMDPFVIPQPQPMPMAPPMAQPYAPPREDDPPLRATTPPADEPKPTKRNNVVAGVAAFGITYGLTVVVARARSDNDPDAKAGYIPIIGPIVWAASDEGKLGEDGWDWLSLLVLVVQGGGLYGAINDLGEDDPPKKKPKSSTAVLRPVSGPGFGGVVFGGSF